MSFVHSGRVSGKDWMEQGMYRLGKLLLVYQTRLQTSSRADWGSWPNGQRRPAGEGGSELCNVSEEAVIRVHPSSGMGTRSHSLTRHKAGCVCDRGGGPREGFDGEQAMTSLYPSTDH